MILETCVYKKGNKWFEGFVAYSYDEKPIIIDKKTGTFIGEAGFLYEGHFITFDKNKLVSIEEA